MPIGSKKKGAKKILEEIEKTNGFEFSRDFILPPELNGGAQKKLLEKVYKKNTRYDKLSEEEQKNETKKMEKLLDEMAEKLREYGGAIQSYVGSEGGSYSKNDKLEQKSNTDYLVIKINNVLIFEPLGQVNNATFIGNAENEELTNELKAVGRIQSVQKELLGRVFHQRTSKGNYNYENEYLLEIMKHANEHPDDLLSTLFGIMKEQTYCTLATLDSRMPNCVDDIISIVGNQVKQRSINAKDVADAETTLSAKDKEISNVKEGEEL